MVVVPRVMLHEISGELDSFMDRAQQLLDDAVEAHSALATPLPPSLIDKNSNLLGEMALLQSRCDFPTATPDRAMCVDVIDDMKKLIKRFDKLADSFAWYLDRRRPKRARVEFALPESRAIVWPKRAPR